MAIMAYKNKLSKIFYINNIIITLKIANEITGYAYVYIIVIKRVYKYSKCLTKV